MSMGGIVSSALSVSRGDDAVDVGGLPGGEELGDDRRFGCGRGGSVSPGQRPGIAFAGQPVSGSLQRAVGRGHAHAEKFASVLRGPAKRIAQDKHDTLRGRQQLKGGDVRQARAFAQNGAVLRAGVRVAGLLQQALGVWLQVRVDGRLVIATLLDHAQRDVGGDAMQPRGHRAALVIAAQAAPRAQHRLLQRIVGIVP
jgi:hypothetical protein